MSKTSTKLRASSRRRWISWLAGIAGLGVVIAMLLSSQSTSATTSNAAPDFTLPTTSDTTVKLSDLRGGPVLIYFNEGAGCGSCIMQQAAIEAQQAEFDALGVTVLPIVMNTKEQIAADMAQYGVKTPFLLDDGTVSAAYGTLGKGMHAGLPGHSFVLIDKEGIQRWYGEYPSMWLEPAELLTEIRSQLS